jgi:hypothetical protein
VLVAGYPRHEIPERVREVIGGEYHTTAFCEEGGFQMHMCYTGPEMDAYEAHGLECHEGVYEALFEDDVIDIDAEVYEYILPTPFTVPGPYGDYDILGQIYGYNEHDDDRYEA